jgi:hypothetical protein
VAQARALQRAAADALVADRLGELPAAIREGALQRELLAFEAEAAERLLVGADAQAIAAATPPTGRLARRRRERPRR